MELNLTVMIVHGFKERRFGELMIVATLLL